MTPEERVISLGNELHKVRGENIRAWGRFGKSLNVGSRTPEEFAVLFETIKRQNEELLEVLTEYIQWRDSHGGSLSLAEVPSQLECKMEIAVSKAKRNS